MKTVAIYTDGACSGNPGPGGWGAILEYNGHERTLSGGAPETTNNRMELTAVIEALKRGWIKSDKKPALNVDLWETLLPLLQTHQVHYHWVKGHSTNSRNNRCDQMAVAESQKYKD